MKPILLTLLVFTLAGCGDVTPTRWEVDQAVRAERFDACLKNIPVGPQTTKYNDWAEVVDSCEDAARVQSLRKVAR